MKRKPLVTSRAPKPEPGTIEHLEQQVKIATREADRLRTRIVFIENMTKSLGVVSGGPEFLLLNMALAQLLRKLTEMSAGNQSLPSKFEWDLRPTTEGGDIVIDPEEK
jgi:acyl-coenzyme A thioesterase PaaI-like protein